MRLPEAGNWTVKIVSQGLGLRHHSVVWAGDFDSVEPTKENITLMASAPDLLHALKRMMEPSNDENVNRSIAELAIKKAEGK